LRGQMRAGSNALQRRLGTTMIYGTDDQVEAMAMADRLVVLRGGRVEQIGTPLELYNHPANRFVAGFIGSPQMNFLTGRVTAVGDGGVRVALDAMPDVVTDQALPLRDAATSAQQKVALGIRPEHVMLGSGLASSMQLSATI